MVVFYILATIIFLFLVNGDIWLTRLGLLPNPSMFIIPLFVSLSILNFFNKRTSMKLGLSHWWYLLLILFSILFSTVRYSAMLIPALSLSIINYFIYCSSLLFFSNASHSQEKKIFLLAYFFLLSTILYELFFSDGGVARGAGIDENPNSAAIKLTILGLMSLSLLKNRIFVKKLFCIVIFLSVFLTLSRSGMIISIISLMFFNIVDFKSIFSFLLIRKNILKGFLTLFILSIFLAAVIPLVISYVPGFTSRGSQERIHQIMGQDELINTGDDDGRIRIFYDYLDLILSNPLGYGTGSSMDRSFYRSATHNTFLRLSIDFGIISFFIYLFYIIRMLTISNSSLLFAFMIVVFFSSFFTNTLFENRTFIVSLAFVECSILKKSS